MLFYFFLIFTSEFDFGLNDDDPEFGFDVPASQPVFRPSQGTIFGDSGQNMIFGGSGMSPKRVRLTGSF